MGLFFTVDHMRRLESVRGPPLDDPSLQLGSSKQHSEEKETKHVPTRSYILAYNLALFPHFRTRISERLRKVQQSGRVS